MTPREEIYFEASVDQQVQIAAGVGPCDHFDCDERAAMKILISVGGVHTQAWTCAEHGQMLVEGGVVG